MCISVRFASGGLAVGKTRPFSSRCLQLRALRKRSGFSFASAFEFSARWPSTQTQLLFLEMIFHQYPLLFFFFESARHADVLFASITLPILFHSSSVVFFWVDAWTFLSFLWLALGICVWAMIVVAQVFDGSGKSRQSDIDGFTRGVEVPEKCRRRPEWRFGWGLSNMRTLIYMGEV